MPKFDFRGERFTTTRRKFTPPPLSQSVFPTGSETISKLTKATLVGSGPSAEDFVKTAGGTTSASEGYIMWALREIFKQYENGGEFIAWTYQSSYLGGRHIPGGAVVDFIIFGELWNTGLRIQTFFFHAGAGSHKQETDFDQKLSLEDGGLRIIDIYEQDYINDPTGKSAIKVVLEALAGVERMNPRSSGAVVDR